MMGTAKKILAISAILAAASLLIASAAVFFSHLPPSLPLLETARLDGNSYANIKDAQTFLSSFESATDVRTSSLYSANGGTISTDFRGDVKDLSIAGVFQTDQEDVLYVDAKKEEKTGDYTVHTYQADEWRSDDQLPVRSYVEAISSFDLFWGEFDYFFHFGYPPVGSIEKGSYLLVNARFQEVAEPATGRFHVIYLGTAQGKIASLYLPDRYSQA